MNGMDRKCTIEVEAIVLEPVPAALRLQPIFKRAARKLRKDFHLREDLAQEMTLSVLRCKYKHPLSYFLQRAVQQAVDYVRRWEKGKRRTAYIHDRFYDLIYDPVEQEKRRQAAIAELKRLGWGFLLEELAVIEAEFAVLAQAVA
jgi:DNA-directed RNA polymerase specialized sigma24 family protein